MVVNIQVPRAWVSMGPRLGLAAVTFAANAFMLAFRQRLLSMQAYIDTYNCTCLYVFVPVYIYVYIYAYTHYIASTYSVMYVYTSV